MKTIEQIKAKIAEVDEKINDIMNECSEWTEVDINNLEQYLQSRMALRWVLSDEKKVEQDDFEAKIRYEILCFESTKIF